jgi:hypothetical protein
MKPQLAQEVTLVIGYTDRLQYYDMQLDHVAVHTYP